MNREDPVFVESETVEEIAAIKAVGEGEATEEQQRLALKTIIEKICRVGDLPYVRGSFDGTAFVGGRQFVGLRIIRHIGTHLGVLREITEALEHGRTRQHRTWSERSEQQR